MNQKGNEKSKKHIRLQLNKQNSNSNLNMMQVLDHQSRQIENLSNKLTASIDKMNNDMIRG
jgi:hypothetical protein